MSGPPAAAAEAWMVGAAAWVCSVVAAALGVLAGAGGGVGGPVGVGHGRDHQVVAERGERDDDSDEDRGALARAEFHGDRPLFVPPYRA